MYITPSIRIVASFFEHPCPVQARSFPLSLPPPFPSCSLINPPSQFCSPPNLQRSLVSPADRASAGNTKISCTGR